MIVTASTSNGCGEEGFSCGADNFVNSISANLSLLNRILITHIIEGATNEKGGSDFDSRVAGADNIASQVFESQAVKGFVVIE